MIARHPVLWLVLGLGLTACSRADTPILDGRDLARRQALDNRDWDWYAANVPAFESPDTAIDATYYYRWDLLTRHLTYGSPASGYSFTEFLDRPFWSGAYGAISCPLGHQLYEARWLTNRRYAQDYARYWFETPGAEPRSYSNWYGDAVWALFLVQPDTAFLRAMLPHLRAQVAGWDAEHWDPAHRLYHWAGMHDGMEFNIDSRQTADAFSGADGYRPTLNSYVFADERAIARASALLGDSGAARDYAARAADLKRQVEDQLWDPARTFFLEEFAHAEKGGIRGGTRTYASGPRAGDPHGREEIGFVPWQFDLPDSGYEAAWRFLMDTAFFFSPRGPTTAERHDPLFYVSPQCCWWSGNEWPYATTQTLAAMANLLDDYHQTVVTGADWFRLLHDLHAGPAVARPALHRRVGQSGQRFVGRRQLVLPQRALLPLGVRGPGHHRAGGPAPARRRHARGAAARARRVALLRARRRGVPRAPGRRDLGPGRKPLPARAGPAVVRGRPPRGWRASPRPPRGAAGPGAAAPARGAAGQPGREQRRHAVPARHRLVQRAHHAAVLRQRRQLLVRRARRATAGPPPAPVTPPTGSRSTSASRGRWTAWRSTSWTTAARCARRGATASSSGGDRGGCGSRASDARRRCPRATAPTPWRSRGS